MQKSKRLTVMIIHSIYLNSESLFFLSAFQAHNDKPTGFEPVGYLISRLY